MGPRGSDLDVEAHVGPALARVLVAANDPLTATSLGEEERDQDGSQRAEDVAAIDEVVFTRGPEAPSVRPGATEVAETAQPRPREVDTCRH